MDIVMDKGSKLFVKGKPFTEGTVLFAEVKLTDYACMFEVWQPLTHRIVSFTQEPNGLWSAKILACLDDSCNTLEKLRALQKDKTLSDDVVYTLVGLAILKKHFAGFEACWKLVARKGRNALKGKIADIEAALQVFMFTVKL